MTGHVSVPSQALPKRQSPPHARRPATDAVRLTPADLEAVRQLIAKAGSIAAARELIEAVQSLQRAA
jgi:hypothetical protein